MDALNAFIHAHHSRLIAMGVRAGLTAHDAEDCAQAAWTYLHKCGRLNVDLPPAFITVTMRGRMQDHWRRLRLKARRGIQSIDGLEESLPDHRTPDKALARKELRRCFQRLGIANQYRSTESMTRAEKTARWRKRAVWKETLMPHAA